VNDLDVIDDTSFVVTGFFVENYENGNTKNVYNQIWWGKKKGYEYKTEKFLVDENYYLESARLEYFAGDHNYYAFGIGPSVVINDKNVIKYLTVYSTNSDIGKLQYQNIELIRPGEFYLYGRNGSLVYYKDGRFTKIDTGTDMNFFCTGSNGTETLLYANYEPLHPKYHPDSLAQSIFRLNKNKIIDIHKFTYALTSTNPAAIRNIYWQNDFWLIGAGSGIFTLNYPFNATKIRDVWSDALYHDGEGNFIAKDLRDRNWYFLENTETQLPNLNPKDFHLKSDYKGRLFIESFSHEVTLGTYNLLITKGIQK